MQSISFNYIFKLKRKQMKTRLIYGISFIEGGVVMVAELAGAKLLTPFFGASLYSWASTLSITLLALMAGYYYGGYVTTKPKFATVAKILWVFVFSGLTVFLMPTLGHFIMHKTITFSFFTGLIVSQLFFLFLPIFLMGMISPMIVFQVTKKAEESGRSAGNIYAISTSGGILFTLLFGFLIIPSYGISIPVRVLGLAVAAIGLLLLMKEKISLSRKHISLIVIFIIASIAFSQGKSKTAGQVDMNVVASSEGLMGQLKVVDQISYPPDKKPIYVRRLMINNIAQNAVLKDQPTQSLLYYVNFTKQLIQFLPEKESALLIGLGAGSLYKILSDNYTTVNTVEIDKRMYDMGVKYFGMAEHTTNTITDGRYYINIEKKKYDLIVLDAIIGENVPAQLTTLESFQLLYALLNENGALIIENGGLTGFSGNSFVPSILKTLEAAGFHVSLFNPMMSTVSGDAVFVATKIKIETKGINFTDDLILKAAPLDVFLLPITLFDNTKATILTDDENNSDVLLRNHYFQVRKGIRKELAKYNFWE